MVRQPQGREDEGRMEEWDGSMGDIDRVSKCVVEGRAESRFPAARPRRR